MCLSYLGDEMIPMVLAALVPDVVQAAIVGDAGAIVDGLQLAHLPVRHGHVANDVEDRKPVG